MRKFVFFILFLSLFSFGFFNPLLTQGSREKSMEIQSIKQTEKTYDINISFNSNNTVYYMYIEDSILEFSIIPNSWGTNFNIGLHGLIIELIMDESSKKINSWLIQSGDSSEHHYTSETSLNGVIQICFSILNIDNANFSIKLGDKNPIWKYSTFLQHNQERYFCVERSAEAYEMIENVELYFSSDYSLSLNLSLEVKTLLNESILKQQLIFTSNSTNIVSLFSEQGYSPNKWYKIIFSFNKPINNQSIVLSMFYDHIQRENIIRAFLNIGDYNTEAIPIDQAHRENYFWIINDSTLIIDYPPKPNYLAIVLQILILLVMTSVIVLTFTLIVKEIKKSKKQSKRIELEIPSSKFHKQEEERIIYSPKSSFYVEFSDKSMDYSLVTDKSSSINCSICLQPIKLPNQLIRCPSCDVAFHKDHLYQWVAEQGTCPICKVNLRIKHSR